MANPLFQPVDPDVLLYPHEEAEPMGQTGLHFLFVTLVLDYLRTALRERADVYVVADQFVYYVEGDPKRVVAPDVAVYVGAGRQPRRVWKVWSEGGKVPDFVVEVLSDTSSEDIGAKRTLYGSLGVREYLVLDPERQWVPEGIRAYRQEGGELERVRPVNGRVYLDSVGLWFAVDGEHVQAWTAGGVPLAAIEDLAAALAERAREIEERDREIEERDREIEERDREIERRQRESEEREREIAALKLEIARLRGN